MTEPTAEVHTDVHTDRGAPTPRVMTIVSLAERPELAAAAVDLAWADWGEGLPDDEYRRWLALAEHDARTHSACAAGFVALHDGRVIGSVSVHEFDMEELRDRSPWVCGMIVAPDARGGGVGAALLGHLERFVASGGVDRLWVCTDTAPGFYRRCGWRDVERVIRDGAVGQVLVKDVVGRRVTDRA